MSPQLKTFALGFRKTLPFIGGVVPFGILYATLAISIGFPWWLVVLLSVLVFAGSSQLVYIDLVSHLGSPLQAVVGSNIVNARHAIYSAGVSDEFMGFKKKWKFLLAYLLTDQMYAIAIMHREEIRALPSDLQPWFYFGSGMFTWVFWVLSTILGIFFGQLIPASWNLGFSIPLMFLPLVFVVSKTRYAYVTCALAIGFVFLLHDMPYGLGVFCSILFASIAGYFFRRFVEGRR